MRINVVKSFLPPKEDYNKYLDQIWDSHWLTNNGPLLLELEKELKNYLKSDKLLFLANGTVALQLAIKSLGLKGEIITTPYSYCATTTSIIWENCIPRFADISPDNLNINPDLIEGLINENTSAILATHVYGLPCDVDQIESLSKKYNIPVIYDAAHAFGVSLNNRSLLDYGDISTCSFHATKVFHTTEGGLVLCHDDKIFDKLSLYRSFGHVNDNYYDIGINAKNSEFHAAMGLANLPYLNSNIAKRKIVSERYDNLLNFNHIQKPFNNLSGLIYNYAYYPIILENASVCNQVIEALNKEDIFPRRYFYPSLNTLNYSKSTDSCPISESIVHRVLSIPLYPELELMIVDKIAEIINQVVVH